MDHNGNVYGTTYLSNDFYGGIYQLRRSGNGWAEKSLYSFQGGKHGGDPTQLIFGKSGELIGATSFGGQKGRGTAFNLSSSKGRWHLTTLYDFPNSGVGPWAQLTMAAEGNLYGATIGDTESSCGTVFKLIHSSSGWKETVLHRFTGNSDGCDPYSTVVFDSRGNLYGTTSQGGLSITVWCSRSRPDPRIDKLAPHSAHSALEVRPHGYPSASATPRTITIFAVHPSFTLTGVVSCEARLGVRVESSAPFAYPLQHGSRRPGEPLAGRPRGDKLRRGECARQAKLCHIQSWMASGKSKLIVCALSLLMPGF